MMIRMTKIPLRGSRNQSRDTSCRCAWCRRGALCTVPAVIHNHILVSMPICQWKSQVSVNHHFSKKKNSWSYWPWCCRCISRPLQHGPWGLTIRTMNTKTTLTIMMLNNNDDADNVNDDADWWQGGLWWWWWWWKITSCTCQLSWSLPQAVSISLLKKASSRAPSWSSAPCACWSPTCSASPSPASSSTRSLLSVWESEWGAFHVEDIKVLLRIVDD